MHLDFNMREVPFQFKHTNSPTVNFLAPTALYLIYFLHHRLRVNDSLMIQHLLRRQVLEWVTGTKK